MENLNVEMRLLHCMQTTNKNLVVCLKMEKS